MLPSWDMLEQVFTVETIMTPRTHWQYWDGEEYLDNFWQRVSDLHIDVVPVIVNDKIIALRERDNGNPISLTEDWIISHDAPISHALDAFASRSNPCLLVSQHQGVVIGLVTPADLNKAPARAFIFSLLVELEMTIASVVGFHFKGRQQDILGLINPKDKKEILSTIEEMERTDREIELVHLLYLSDLVNILRNEETLRVSLEFDSSSQVKKQLGGLVHLRDDVVHPVRLLLGETRDISKLRDQVQRVQTLLVKIVQNGLAV